MRNELGCKIVKPLVFVEICFGVINKNEVLGAINAYNSERKGDNT